MDLSTGDNIDLSRQRIIEHSPIMVGTVPLYQATVRAIREHGAVVEMTLVHRWLDPAQRDGESAL